MSQEDSRISQLPLGKSGIRQGTYAKYNPLTDDTEQIGLQEDMGAVKADFAWQADTTYSTGDLVDYIGAVWKSLQNSNVGNVPTENAFWTNEPISDADGITDTQWAAGVFTYDDSKVIYNNGQYYLQVAAPYISSDILAEITAGDWATSALGLVDEIDFTGNDNGYLDKRLNWDQDQKCPAFTNDIPDSKHQLGRELWKRCINKTGGTLLNGKSVKAGSTDAITGLATITYASASDVNIADLIGFLTHDVLDNGECEVVPFGDVNDINTSGLTVGTVYLSDTAGEVSNTPPNLPSAIVIMGRAEKIDISAGRIYARVQTPILPDEIPLNASWSAFSGSTTAPNYVFGYYTFEAAVTPTATPVTMGSANVAYGAHVYFVLGASSTDMVIRVSGTSYDDESGRTPSDFEDVDTSGLGLDDYIETSKKFIGQISFVLQSGTGVITDYGWSKYWDNQNSRFVGTGAEWVGRAGAATSSPNISYIHHQSTGWTYTGAGAINPTPVTDMQTEYVTEYQFANGEYFAFKVIGLSEVVQGELDEGLIVQVDINANNAVSESTVTVMKIG